MQCFNEVVPSVPTLFLLLHKANAFFDISMFTQTSMTTTDMHVDRGQHSAQIPCKLPVTCKEACEWHYDCIKDFRFDSDCISQNSWRSIINGHICESWWWLVDKDWTAMSLSCNTPTHSCLIHKHLRNVFCKNVGEMVFLCDTHTAFFIMFMKTNSMISSLTVCKNKDIYKEHCWIDVFNLQQLPVLTYNFHQHNCQKG